MEYTQKEVKQNIDKLTDSMELMKKERTVLSQNINSTKKQIEYWIELDESQLKMF